MLIRSFSIGGCCSSNSALTELPESLMRQLRKPRVGGKGNATNCCLLCCCRYIEEAERRQRPRAGHFPNNIDDSSAMYLPLFLLHLQCATMLLSLYLSLLQTICLGGYTREFNGSTVFRLKECFARLCEIGFLMAGDDDVFLFVPSIVN